MLPKEKHKKIREVIFLNEFVIEWVKGSAYAGVTVPIETALKNKLLRLSKERPGEVRMMAENPDGSASSTSRSGMSKSAHRGLFQKSRGKRWVKGLKPCGRKRR